MPSAPFDLALDHVLREEGGYSNDPDDDGGETKYGISKSAHPEVDIASLSLDQAAAIYRRDYWDRCRCEEMPRGLDLALFDAAVNQGAVAAIRMLQEAVGVTPDGVLGPRTMMAVACAPTPIARFMERRATRYVSTVRARSTQIKYLAGWMGRLVRTTAAAVAISSNGRLS